MRVWGGEWLERSRVRPAASIRSSAVPALGVLVVDHDPNWEWNSWPVILARHLGMG